MPAIWLLTQCASASYCASDSAISKNSQIRTGSTLGCSKLIRYVRPTYPKEAKAKHLEGIVKLRILITKAGTVRILEVLDGPPELVPSALAAVKQWRYSTCKINGQAISAITAIVVDFTLSV